MRAQELIKIFREIWSHQKELLQYLDKNYFGRAAFETHEWQVRDVQKGWMICYCQDMCYASIDTNNYIESWHNTLKRHFFRDKHQRCADTVIYVLAILAVPHFQQKCIRSIVKVGRMNPAQLKELQLTTLATDHIKNREANGYIGAYIKQTSEDTLYVESFTNAEVGYDIKIDFSKTPTGHITRCSCKYFSDHQSCCKHIALVQLELPPITFFRADVWEHQSNFHPGILELYTPDEPAYAAPEMNHISIGIQRLGLLEELWDKKAEYPRQLLVQTKLQELIDLFEASFPRLQGQGLSNKRPRQQY